MDIKYLVEKIDKIDMKLDKVLEHSASVDVTMARQNVQLELHMKRSDSLEKYVSVLEDKIVPIEKHLNMTLGAFKMLGILVTFLGVIIGVYKLYLIAGNH